MNSHHEFFHVSLPTTEATRVQFPLEAKISFLLSHIHNQLLSTRALKFGRLRLKDIKTLIKGPTKEAGCPVGNQCGLILRAALQLSDKKGHPEKLVPSANL